MGQTSEIKQCSTEESSTLYHRTRTNTPPLVSQLRQKEEVKRRRKEKAESEKKVQDVHKKVRPDEEY